MQYCFLFISNRVVWSIELETISSKIIKTQIHSMELSGSFLMTASFKRFLVHSKLENHFHLCLVSLIVRPHASSEVSRWRDFVWALMEWKKLKSSQFQTTDIRHHKCSVTSIFITCEFIIYRNIICSTTDATGHRKLSASFLCYALFFGRWKYINRGWCRRAAQLICIFMFEQCFKLNVAAKM